MDLADLLRIDGQANMGGTARRCYIAKAEDVDVWPTLDGSPTNPEDLVTAITPFVMKSGKAFKAFDLVQETGKLDDDKVGSHDCESFAQKLEGFISNADKTRIGFAALSR